MPILLLRRAIIDIVESGTNEVVEHVEVVNSQRTMEDEANKQQIIEVVCFIDRCHYKASNTTKKA